MYRRSTDHHAHYLNVKPQFRKDKTEKIERNVTSGRDRKVARQGTT